MVEPRAKNPGGEGAERRRGGVELTVPQVAASAAAAVAGAVLISKLGVFGTVIGAGVMSVVATAGGAVFQHLFDRLRVRPAAREASPSRAPRPRRAIRRRVAAAAGVFLLAMAAVTGLELASGSALSGWWHGDDRAGTSVGRLLEGGAGGGQEPAGGTEQDDPGQDEDAPTREPSVEPTGDPTDQPEPPTPSDEPSGEATTPAPDTPTEQPPQDTGAEDEEEAGQDGTPSAEPTPSESQDTGQDATQDGATGTTDP